jgi:hypothetical protein
VLGSCYQAAAAGLSLIGERAGQPTLRLMHPPAVRGPSSAAPLCAEARGVHVHASAAIEGRDRPRLLRLCRYIARPPLAAERLLLMPDGQLRYVVKIAWKDGPSRQAPVFSAITPRRCSCSHVEPRNGRVKREALPTVQ